MAYGMELVLGWLHKDWEGPLKALGLEVEYRGGRESPHGIEVKDSDRGTEVDRLLRQAQRAAIREMGWEVRAVDEAHNLLVTTPLGTRELSPFRLSVYFGRERDDGAVEAALLCVPLSSRYRPRFLDWKSSYGTLWPVVLDDEMRRMMDIARRHIVQVLPAFEAAPFVVSLEHY